MNRFDYRPVSWLSILALATSVIGFGAFLAPAILVFSIASILLAITSFPSIRRYDLSGLKLATASVCIAGFTLLVAPAWHSYLYTTESIPGHIRVDLSTANMHQAIALDGYANKPICLKGYVLPPSRHEAMRTFCLSPDGNATKPEQSITVQLSFEWQYDYAPVAVSGILTVNPNCNDPSERYLLTAEKVHRSNTPHDLRPRAPGHGC